VIVRGPILTGLALARIRFRVSAEPRHIREAAAPAGSSRVGSPSGLRIISGRGPNMWQISRAIDRAERIASPDMSPTATAAIVATQGGKSFMVPCPRHANPTRLRTHRLTNCWLVPFPCTGAHRPCDDCEIKPERAPAFPPYPRNGAIGTVRRAARGARRGVQGYSLRVRLPKRA
jgi:hypothetical protein